MKMHFCDPQQQPQPQQKPIDRYNSLLISVINLRAAFMEVKRSMNRVEEKFDSVFERVLTRNFQEKEDHREE